jgi:hypothetical protein
MPTRPLLAALQGVLAASEDLVAESESAAEEALGGLCWSARQNARRMLERAESGFDQARLDGARGAWSNALSRLGRAAGEFRSVVSNAATAAARCRPRACRASDAFHFERGRAGNPELRLVPPDRGTLAVYRVSGSDAPSFSTTGSLRLAFDGLTRARVTSRLTSAGRTLDFQGTFSTSACLDGNGWYRLASITESLRASNGARGGGSLRLTPAGVAVPPPGLVPVVPQAVAMRVGDRIVESDVRIAASAARGAPPFRCSGEHRVVAIEELRVAAGTFSAARVESYMACPGGPALDWISWLASGIGFARVELRDADTYAEFELTCFETPETPGACAAASVPAPSLGGSGFVLHGPSSPGVDAAGAGLMIMTLPPLPPVSLEAGTDPGAAPE